MWWEEKTYKAQLDGWFAAIEESWPQLSSLIANFHPHTGKVHTMRITALAAEAVRLEVAAEIAGELDYPEIPYPLARASQALQERDAEEMHKLLQQTWFGIPESTDSWGLPRFGLLCDLCSDFPTPEWE